MKKVVGLWIGMVWLSCSIFAQTSKYDASHYKYIGTFIKQQGKQKMDSVMSLEDFRKIIKKRWAEGYDISEIKYGNGKWIGVFTEASENTGQTYVVASRWGGINNILKEYWDKGYYMTNIEHGLAEWIVVFEKNRPYSNQAFERRKTLDAFIAYVNKRWDEGFDLIDFEYGQGRWTGIFAENTGYSGQALIVRSSWKAMARMIEKYWGKGYRIGNIEYTLGKWMCLFTKVEEPVSQGFETAPTAEALRKIWQKKQKDHYILTDLAEGW